jgi:putative transposase
VRAGGEWGSSQRSKGDGRAFTERLRKGVMQINMDGRCRALDNVFVERLWRTVKYEEVYVQD